MRMIGTVPDETAARRLGDYLLSVGIDNHVEASAADGASWLVWVERDDDLERGRAELEQFQRNPADERYAAAMRLAAQIRAQRQAKQQRWSRNFRDVRTGWGLRAHAGPGPVTLALVAFCAIVFVVSSMGRYDEKLNPLRIQPVEYLPGDYVAYSRTLEAVRAGEVWRLVTPILIHYGVIHLLFNMSALVHLGSQIEDRKGSLMLVVLVLVSAVPSNILQFMDSGPMFGGMSGVVYALFGYVWLKGRFQPEEGMGVDRSTVILAFVWLVLCMTPLLGNIANTAHVVGLLIGLAFGAIPYLWRRARTR